MSPESLRIEIDRTACRGAAQCVHRAPRSFALDRERRATVRHPPEDSEEAIRNAEHSCPNFAIRVTRVARRRP